jgi:two-component system invasion response regulator UvrY
MITVLLVDDHQLVRSGIKRILQDAPDIDVIAEASSGEEALELLGKVTPQVVLMDLSMPGIGGIEATRKLLRTYPDVRVIALTVYTDSPFPSSLLEAGASGYLTKGCSDKEIVSAIRAVASGERYLVQDVAQQMALDALPSGRKNIFDQLSKRELEVMMMLTSGVSLQEASDRLCLSPKTVSTYRYRLYEKLSVANDVELTHLAIRHGVIKPI